MKDAQAMVAELGRWHDDFTAGRIRLRGFRQPHLEDGEHLGVKVPSVGVQQRPVGESPASWIDDLGGGWRGWRHAPLGGLYVTDRRAFVHGNSPTDIRRVWRWDEQASVTLLPVPIGVVVVGSAGPDLVDVVGSEWNSAVVGSTPKARSLTRRWLMVEAAFAVHQGRFDAWWAALPGRLDGGAHTAR